MLHRVLTEGSKHVNEFYENVINFYLKTGSQNIDSTCFFFQHNDRQMEKFSYLIVTRSDPAEEETEGVKWARLIAPVQRRTRHVHCRVCGPDGQPQHLVVTARKHGR